MDGQAFIFTIPASNGVWQFRTWIASENRQFRKSLRTKRLDEAQIAGRALYAEIIGQTTSGKKLFGEKFSAVTELWLTYQEERAKTGKITSERYSTVKTQINRHIVPFVEEEIGKNTKIGTLGYQSFYDYAMWRRKKHPEVQDVTIRNEQTTIGSLIRFAFRKGYLAFEKCEFEEIKIRDVIRRDTFETEEYDVICEAMTSWVKKEPTYASNSEAMKLNKKQFFRDFVLIDFQTGMRVGELRQLKWGMVKRIITSGGKQYAEFDLPAHICKNRKRRVFISAGGSHLKRIKTYSNFTEAENFVFCNNDDGTQISKAEFYRLWNDLLSHSGIKINRRNLSPYSLRHYAITARLYAHVPVYNIAKDAGTSVSYIEDHYEHMDRSKMLQNAKKRFRVNKEGWVEPFERA